MKSTTKEMRESISVALFEVIAIENVNKKLEKAIKESSKKIAKKVAKRMEKDEKIAKKLAKQIAKIAAQSERKHEIHREPTMTATVKKKVVAPKPAKINIAS